MLGTIRGFTTNKNYYYINVVCFQIVSHWSTNPECSINRGIMAIIIQHVVRLLQESKLLAA